jgi:hypothetical protein
VLPFRSVLALDHDRRNREVEPRLDILRDAAEQSFEVARLESGARDLAQDFEIPGPALDLLVEAGARDGPRDLLGDRLGERELVAERRQTRALRAEQRDDAAAVLDRHAHVRERAGEGLDVVAVQPDVVEEDRAAGRGDLADDAAPELAAVADVDRGGQVGGHRLAGEAGGVLVDPDQGHELPAEPFGESAGDPLEHRPQLQVLGRDPGDLDKDRDIGRCQRDARRLSTLRGDALYVHRLEKKKLV